MSRLDWLGIISAIVLVGAIGLLFLGGAYGYETLPYIDFAKPMYQHIHVYVSPTFQGGIGITPAKDCPPESPPLSMIAPYPGCPREMHTHFADGWIHIESTEPKNFTMSQFLDLAGKSTMEYTSLTINGNNATWTQVLKDGDVIAVK
jgi:hypothetical protein